MTGQAALPGTPASLALHRLSGFAATLRDAGLGVSPEDVISAVEALNALDLADPDSLYWGLRMAMVRRAEDLPLFERVFRAYWHGIVAERQEQRARDRPGRYDKAESAGESAGTGEQETENTERKRESIRLVTEDGEGDDPLESAAYSAHEVLREKDFADCDESDYQRLRELLEEARFEGPWRTSRRRRLSKRGLLDVRKTLRASFRTGGHPMRRIHRRPRSKQRQLTFVCDVSGSMEPYSKAVIQLAYVTAKRRPRVEAFAFATRLTRLTDDLPRKRPSEAVAGAASQVVDWSGGTRMGSCLAELNRTHRSAVLGAVVVIASDGWDLGDPRQLAGEAELLHRLAHTLIWVNPHLQDPEFEPLTQGMSAALPSVDHFISCHNFESFATLASLLEAA